MPVAVKLLFTITVNIIFLQLVSVLNYNIGKLPQKRVCTYFLHGHSTYVLSVCK